MILTKQRLIFVKIPKTAGTTVAHTILNALGVTHRDLTFAAINLNDLRAPKRGANGWHVPLARIENYLGDQYEQFRKFTVLRDPVERLVSAYRWQIRRDVDLPPIYGTFERFAKAVIRGHDQLNAQSHIHVLPQSHWLTESDGEIGDVELFSTERLNESWQDISSLLDMPCHPVDDRNISPKDQEIDVSTSMRREILDHYAQDAKLHDKAMSRSGPRLSLANV